MSKEKYSPAPFRIVGSHAGSPIMLRSYADRVEISHKGINNSFPNIDAALLFLQSFFRQKKIGKVEKKHDFTK